MKITFNEWLEHKKYQRSFDAQIYKYYNWNGSFPIRNNMGVEDFKQHMLIFIYNKWYKYNEEFQCDTFTNGLIKYETCHLNRKFTTDKAILNSLDTVFRLDAPTDKDQNFEIPFVEEDNSINEAIEYIIKHVDEKDKDICKLHLLGYSMKDIEKFCGMSWRQVQYRVKEKYKKLFMEKFREYYGG